MAARFAGLSRWPTPAEMDERLAGDAGVRFVSTAKVHRRRRAWRPLDVEALYEVRIAQRGEVPTRPESWHDFLNALIWASFPRSKRALTVRLAREQEAQARVHGWRLPNRRTRVQDRLALLDEGGVVTSSGSAVVFGHAILEHLIDGRVPRVSSIPLDAGASSVDTVLAAYLEDVDRWSAGPRPTAVELETL